MPQHRQKARAAAGQKEGGHDVGKCPLPQLPLVLAGVSPAQHRDLPWALSPAAHQAPGVPSLLPPRALTAGAPRWERWPLNPISQGWPLAEQGRFQEGCSALREIRNP